MSLIWFATNNSVTVDDLPDLEVFGITLGQRSAKPVTTYRDPISGRMVAELGLVRVWRDGRVRIIPRTDCPDGGVSVLVRTALDCVERELHKRDSWHYTRATKDRPGRWGATILCTLREGASLFAEHAEILGLGSVCERPVRTARAPHRHPEMEPAEPRPIHQPT